MTRPVHHILARGPSRLRERRLPSFHDGRLPDGPYVAACRKLGVSRRPCSLALNVRQGAVRLPRPGNGPVNRKAAGSIGTSLTLNKEAAALPKP